MKGYIYIIPCTQKTSKFEELSCGLASEIGLSNSCYSMYASISIQQNLKRFVVKEHVALIDLTIIYENDRWHQAIQSFTVTSS